MFFKCLKRTEILESSSDSTAHFDLQMNGSELSLYLLSEVDGDRTCVNLGVP